MTRRKDKDESSLYGMDGTAAGSLDEAHPEGTSAEEEKSSESSYIKIGSVKLGDTLVVLGDEFDCLHDGDEREVLQDDRGRLYVECEEGKHWLDKTDIHDYVVGLGTKAV